jgi:hypothetical protein
MDVVQVAAPAASVQQPRTQAPAPAVSAIVARPHLAASRIGSGEPRVAPVIDGKVDDAIWQTATATSAFTQKTPNDGRAPSEKTTVRILYDDDALYVAFECEQTHTPVVQRLTRRDRVVEADWVAFDVGTRSDGKSAFEFVVNASGVLADGIRFNDTDYSSDWDENWDARVAHEDGMVGGVSDSAPHLEVSVARRSVLGFSSAPLRVRAPRDRRVGVHAAQRRWRGVALRSAR